MEKEVETTFFTEGWLIRDYTMKYYQPNNPMNCSVCWNHKGFWTEQGNRKIFAEEWDNVKSVSYDRNMSVYVKSPANASCVLRIGSFPFKSWNTTGPDLFIGVFNLVKQHGRIPSEQALRDELAKLSPKRGCFGVLMLIGIGVSVVSLVARNYA